YYWAGHDGLVADASTNRRCGGRMGIEDGTTRSDAIRRHVESGLTIKSKANPPSPASAARAKVLAKTAIDKMTDATAPPEEQPQRRRRLIKGPSEFREHRMDQAKGNDGRK